MTCLECNGEGYVDQFKECGYPASMCCGACSSTERCSVCYGYGEVTADTNDDYGKRLEDILQQANLNADKHEALIENIEKELFDHLTYMRLR